MTRSAVHGTLLYALAIFALLPASEALATAEAHMPGAGRDQPWTNCTTCHGSDLMGGFVGISCFDCHNDFSEPDPPPQGHHAPPGEWDHVLTEPRQDPFANGCTVCHGSDLSGDAGPSCYTCHGELWGGGSENSPPDVDHGGPYFGAPDVPILFDASNSIDADGDVLIYLWTFGDGSTPQFPSQSPTISHTYENVGTYTVTLTVTDGVNDPVIVETTATITDNLPPTADAGGPYVGAVGGSLQFDASGTSDPEGDTLTYVWDFGDGSSPSAPSQSPTASHTYQSDGSYTAVVTVTDGTNDPVMDEAEVEIFESNLPPDVDPGGPYAGGVGQTIQFDASGTSDPDGDLLMYAWVFGDGSTPSLPSESPTTTHIYQNVGTYTATVTVTDGVNDPVAVDVLVEIDDTPLPPEGDTWQILVPFSLDEFTVEFEEFSSILLVHVTQLDGQTSYGIGMEFDGLIFWMDVSGALYMGTVDHQAGTMTGMVFGGPAGSSVWFGERVGGNSTSDTAANDFLDDLMPGNQDGGEEDGGVEVGGTRNHYGHEHRRTWVDRSPRLGTRRGTYHYGR